MPISSFRLRSSRTLACFVASSVAGLAASFSLLPGLSMRSAEGCSGAPGTICGNPGWHSVGLVTGEAAVPTDGLLLSAVSSPSACADAPDPLALRIAAVAGDVTIGGSVSVLATSQASTGIPGGPFAAVTYTLLWRPSQPLAPNAAYALAFGNAEVGASGAAGAAAGAAGTGGGPSPVEPIAFTTAAGPSGAPAAPAGLTATSAATTVATRLCCSYFAGNGGPMCNPIVSSDCVDAEQQSQPELTLSFASGVAEADRPYFEYVIYDNSGEAGVPIFFLQGRDASGPYSFKQIFPDGGRHCLRVETRNLITGQSLSTDAPCPEPAAVNPTVTVNCGELSRLASSCTGDGTLDLRARDLLNAHCEASGPGGGGGSPGGTSGSGAGVPANRSDNDVVSDNDGCQVPAGLGASSGAGGVGLLVGLGALASRRRRAKPVAG